VSIIKHIVTKCSTETSLSHHPGTSVVLSSSAAMSAMLTGASAMTATSSSSSHGEECSYEECALPMLWLVFSGRVANVTIGLLWMFTCRWYYWPVSCGKNDFSHFVASLWPYNRNSLAILPCNAYSFYQLMLERRCQSLG
jgi:hypothetical protein